MKRFCPIFKEISNNYLKTFCFIMNEFTLATKNGKPGIPWIPGKTLK